MWYEILPGFVIITAAMGIPHFSAYVINKLTVGNSYRRSMLTKENRIQYIRDRRLTNDPYKLSGLEAIPDK